jgi:hypothetical protein
MVSEAVSDSLNPVSNITVKIALSRRESASLPLQVASRERICTLVSTGISEGGTMGFEIENTGSTLMSPSA